jgi:hypothetical protein
VKEENVKGFVIARVPSCERKNRERLCDSQNSIMRKKKFVNGSVIPEFHRVKEKVREKLCDIRRLRESLNPTVEGIPTERPETTISCGINPTVEGIPTKAGDNNQLWPKSHR